MSQTPEAQRAAATPAAPPTETRPVERGPAAEGAVAAGESEGRDDRRRRELNRFRGLNLGAAFFGWLVAVGIATLLTAVLGAAGAALALTQNAVANSGTATTLTIAGAVLLAVILLLAYYAGGYVAGRLSRFSGGVQGFGVWIIALLVTVALAVAGAVAGSKYNVLSQLRLPSIPVNGQSFATGGAIALVAMAILTLLAAILGGVMGLRYHRRVDRAVRNV